jgi:hypothetical protein
VLDNLSRHGAAVNAAWLAERFPSVELVGSTGFLYVADSKLATREQMAHIHCRGGRFVSVLPRSRAEDGQIREWAQTHAFDWTEAARRPGKRNGDPDLLWWTAPAPAPDLRGPPDRLGALLPETRARRRSRRAAMGGSPAGSCLFRAVAVFVVTASWSATV